MHPAHRRELTPLALALGLLIGSPPAANAADLPGAACKLIAGVRSISLIGAEIAYIDLGMTWTFL